MEKEPETSLDDLPGVRSRYEDFLGTHIVHADDVHFVVRVLSIFTLSLKDSSISLLVARPRLMRPWRDFLEAGYLAPRSRDRSTRSILYPGPHPFFFYQPPRRAMFPHILIPFDAGSHELKESSLRTGRLLPVPSLDDTRIRAGDSDVWLEWPHPPWGLVARQRQ